MAGRIFLVSKHSEQAADDGPTEYSAMHDLHDGAQSRKPPPDDGVVPVPATIHVAWDGHVGLWIPMCPFCGFEHTHGAYPFYDIREAFKAAGGYRSSHCHQMPWEVPTDAGTYRLTPAPGPARFAPGASRFVRARRAMTLLGVLGIETSKLEIESTAPRWWWKMRGGT